MFIRQFTIKPEHRPEPPKLKVIENSEYGAKLLFKNEGDYSIIMRNGLEVVTVYYDGFIDYKALFNKENVYQIKAVRDFNFSSSNKAVSFLNCDYVFVCDSVNGEKHCVGKVLSQEITKNNSFVQNSYVGRKLPTHTTDGSINETLNITADFTSDNMLILREISERQIFIKHRLFGGFHGAIKEINVIADNQDLKTITFSVERSDFSYN